MAEKRDKKAGQALEGQLVPANHFRNLRLATVRDCRREMAKVYREARGGSMETNVAARLCWMLQALVGAIRDYDLEQRLAALEAEHSARRINR
jgi:hypothetical protein